MDTANKGPPPVLDPYRDYVVQPELGDGNGGEGRAPLLPTRLPKRRARARRCCARMLCFLVFAPLVIYYSRPLWKGIWYKILNRIQEPVDTDLGCYAPPINPGNEDCINRANWTTTPLEGSSGFMMESQTSFKFPVSLPLVSIVNRGTLAHGIFEITDDAPIGGDEMRVDVTVFHNTAVKGIFDVCSIYRGADGMGVGIFTPYENRFELHRQKTHVQVKLRLPKSKDGQLRSFNGVETDLCKFTHRVPDLEHSFSFEKLRLGSKQGNSPVYVKSVYGKDISVRTTNSPIVGSFNATRRVSLSTTNAHIKADIALDNDGVEQSSIQLRAPDGPSINSSITLTSSTENKKGGSFRVGAETTKGDININFPSAPINHNLVLSAQTHFAPAHVTLHETFEGRFVLRSAYGGKSFVDWDEQAEDPTGKGRVRNVTLDMDKGWYRGHTEWVDDQDRPDEPHGQGNVLVTTKMADAALDISPSQAQRNLTRWFWPQPTSNGVLPLW